MRILMYSACTAYIFYLSICIGIMQAHATEKNIVVIIAAYNNKQWYKTNLDSIFSQAYSNYRIIYTDDCSTDGTGDLVEQYIKERDQEHRVTLIKNTKRRRAMANRYAMIHMCNGNEIIAIVDGDDWLAHDNVFTYINNLYKNPNVWMSYGRFKTMPLEALSNPRPFPEECVKNNAYRSYSWCFSHLYTFYAWLAQHIKLEDCLYTEKPLCGKFFASATDKALLYPIIEMTGGRYKCVPEVLYIYNMLNPLNNFKILDKYFKIYNNSITYGNHIIDLKYPKYSALSQPHIRNIKALQHEKADILIFTHNHSQDTISSTLTALHAYVQGINNMIVISDQDNLKKQLETILRHESASKYVLLTSPEYIVQKTVNLGECIQALEQTFAYGFYLGKSKERGMPPHTSLNTAIRVWQFQNDTRNWCSPLNLETTLYRKKDILQAIQSLTCTTIEELRAQLPKVAVNNRKIGLFYKERVLINNKPLLDKVSNEDTLIYY